MTGRPARILVIRLSSMGDIVLTTPVLRALHSQLHGGAEVHMLVKESFAFLVQHNPHVDRVHTFRTTVQEALPALEQLEFDYVIDLQRNFRSRIVIRRLGALAFRFRKCNFIKWLWVNTGWRIRPIPHVVERYMETLSAFGVKDDGKGLDCVIPDQERVALDTLPEAHRAGYVAMAIGGAHVGKRMTTGQWAAVCRLLDYPVVLLGGPEDAAAAAEIEALAGGKVWSGAGRLTVHQGADLMRQARVVVSGDTGMMHLAAALRCRIVSVWGCTVPGLGMAPWRPHPGSVIIEPKGRRRRPCSKLGNRCRYGARNRCITAVDPEEVAEAVRRLW